MSRLENTSQVPQFPKKYAIVTLSHYPEFATKFIASIKQFHRFPPEIIAICDRHDHELDCSNIRVDGPFVFAKNANIGMKLCKDQDVVLCNDDLECVSDNFFDRLSEIAHKYPKCGIMSPLIDGGVGNALQQYPPIDLWEKVIPTEIGVAATVCFPCVYLKREMINQVGYLDESFDKGYGFEDDDYCNRARELGWWTMITKTLHIKHGTGGDTLDRGKNWSCSFVKEVERPSNMEVYMRKWRSQS